MTKEGEWTDKKEGTDFTVDRKNGTVTFTTAPGASPVTGYDNVEITAAKTRKGYADKINKCKIISLFGVNGAMDRMFLSGNPDFPNRDWYCKMADGFFWGDLWYSTLGQDGSAIVGYSIINDRLAAHKSDAEYSRLYTPPWYNDIYHHPDVWTGNHKSPEMHEHHNNHLH